MKKTLKLLSLMLAIVLSLSAISVEMFAVIGGGGSLIGGGGTIEIPPTVGKQITTIDLTIVAPEAGETAPQVASKIVTKVVANGDESVTRCKVKSASWRYSSNINKKLSATDVFEPGETYTLVVELTRTGSNRFQHGTGGLHMVSSGQFKTNVGTLLRVFNLQFLNGSGIIPITIGAHIKYTVPCEVHTFEGGTCVDNAVCSVCGAVGELNPEIHATDAVEYGIIDNHYHNEHHACCEEVIETNIPHVFRNNVCMYCGFGRQVVGYRIVNETYHIFFINGAAITTEHDYNEYGVCKFCEFIKPAEAPAAEDEYVDIIAPTESETEETEDDVVVEENPVTGLALAVIPAIVAMAAAVVSKKR